MRLSCLQENFNRGLAIVGRAVATRTTLPITQNVLLSTDQSRLKLAATNLEIAITTWVGAQIEEEGAVTVPARLLTEFITSLPAGKIDIASTPRPIGIYLRSDRTEAHVNGADVQEFPPIPSVQEGAVAKITPGVLRTAINQVAFAAATEDSRPVLTGVKVEIEEERFTLAAADGFRLAVHTNALAEPVVEEGVAFIVPARALQELNRLIGDQEEPVEITVNLSRSQVMVRLKNIDMVSQLIQGTFPNYAQLIPQSYGTKAVVDLQELFRATRTASIFARDGSGIVRLQITPGSDGMVGKMTISSRAEEVGDNQGVIDAKVEGDESKIAFNGKYLMDVLSVLDRGEVAIETTTPSSPGVLKPVGFQGYTHVVMPMFVQW